jgi:hypothetical protein
MFIQNEMQNRTSGFGHLNQSRLTSLWCSISIGESRLGAIEDGLGMKYPAVVGCNKRSALHRREVSYGAMPVGYCALRGLRLIIIFR